MADAPKARAPEPHPPSERPHTPRRRLLEPDEVEPLDVDGVHAMLVGTVVWTIGLLGLLPFYGRLQEADQGWWLWTCLAGAGLGLLGFAYCYRRRSRLQE